MTENPTSQVHTEIEVRSTAYRYLWLKRFHAFDPNQHCANCLIGDYQQAALPAPWQGRKNGHLYKATVELPNQHALYLCGVWNPPEWARNLHVLMVAAEPDAEVEIETPGIWARFRGVTRLEVQPLPTEDPDQLAELGLRAGKAFTTCRNYQAGFMLRGEGLRPQQPRQPSKNAPTLF